MPPRIVDLKVQNGLRKAVFVARRAAERVVAARDLCELMRAGDVPVDPLVRLMAAELPEVRALDAAVHARAGQIVGAHLARLERILETHGVREFEACVRRLRREHWGYLHGPRVTLRDAAEAHVERLVRCAHGR